ncbi:MAG: TonB-dependent receptor plug domain-containing protein [Gammaproteobacteria bacterium]
MHLKKGLAVLCILVSAVAQAQDSAKIVRQTFEPADFDRFAPRTALDMARQVPGFTIDQGDSSRGFGQASTNLLINGRRISGKSNGPVDALSRIPVDDVATLEILDGASLDIGGLSGQVLNIITRSGGGISGRYRYSPQYRTDDLPFRWGNMEVSIAGGSEFSQWTLSLANNQEKFGNEGPERLIDADGQVIDTRDEVTIEDFDQPGLAGSYTRVDEAGRVLNLTGEVNWFLFDFLERSERNPIDDVARERQLRQSEDEFNFEVGADYEFGLGSGRLKLIGLHRFEHSPTEARTDFIFADSRPNEGSLFERTADEAETVVRSEYTVGGYGGDWQLSFEGTRNYLDIEAELSERNASNELEPVDLPGASSRVEEDRAEVTLSYSRALAKTLQLQTSLGAEYSEISQIGEFGQTRDFVRPKGFVSLNWRASVTRNVSMRVERRVGQLSFFDFISSVNINQDRINVTNADLVPSQSWLFDVEIQQSFGDYGSATLSAFYEDISDIVDRIPIEDGGQAAGNIDEAKRYGASTNITLLFDLLGWKGARLDLEAEYIDSEVRDPLLGTKRRISRDDYLEYEATLRVDFPGTQWAAGISVDYNENTPLVRVDEISVSKPSAPFTFVFLEHKDVFGMTVRGSLRNINDQSDNFFRTAFNDRLTNDVLFREERFREFGLVMRVDFEGGF